jgi:plasmid stabilization system protein ParE
MKAMPRKITTISFADSTVMDLDEIRDWYTAQQIPRVGEQLVKNVVSCVERLGDFPESGRIVPEFGIANLREVIRPPFRIVYRLDESRVRIIRVRRSERLLSMP